jgi:hypothetical protein
LNKVIAVILPPVILTGGWLYLTIKDPVADKNNEITASASPAATVENTEPRPTFSSDTVTIVEAPLAPSTPPNPTTETSLATTASSTLTDEASTLGSSALSDEAFRSAAAQLQSDPAFLTATLAQFRQTTDPTRAKRLAALLADIDDPRIFETAAELAYSGDPQSQLIGLDLLNRIQTSSSDARDVAIQLLGTETNEQVLVAVMDVIATPARNATVSQRQLISDNLFLLSTHPAPAVRAHSLSVLSQWRRQSTEVTRALSDALLDADPHVRASATYALNGRAPLEAQDVERLLTVMENQSEARTTREAAMLTLQNESLPGAERRRFANAQKALRTRSSKP